ncbi:aminotransferase class I/II-fold pyridoxal phosphate-dependent enzyme [Shimazuella sp. AN120528]|uniref:aminotransferase class I/II-fold pyridoxal phosphate-dependent enzyme n=1 Tax=Shimazuella soli TaxID=1892854 RepID=UPI001F0D411A|nr:aminotransferase class I/II-fold pyridoxal phosphate-dependent enzyme [Shimazuella soli]MCH5585827.1 aminotransferase class I/II-fold pyridoxal phosphate-dependent enzyme [Shimazuella soli]
MFNHTRAPLWEALLHHASISQANFHVPGHKAGQVFDQEGSLRFSSLLPIDLTEVGDLDDLHAPTGVIREAQQLAADAFGADQTRFLVGGTTAGILATILAICKPEDKILVARHCHQSVFHGAFLAGATVVPIPYTIDPDSGLEMPTSPDAVEHLLEMHPDAKAVILTSPTYYGVVQQIEKLARIVHQRYIPLIVDEAHGAHFGFHPDLPDRAISHGADISIQSTHKLLPSLTMSSMLHIKKGLIDAESIDMYLSVVQSSSPSYPLMASLDLARRYMMMEGKGRLTEVIHRIQFFRRRIRELPQIKENTILGIMEPMKLSLTSTFFSGYEFAEALEAKKIYVELADDQKVLIVFSLGTEQSELDYLYHCLAQLHEENQVNRPQKNVSMLTPREGEILPYAECRTMERCFIPVSQAIGKRSAVHLLPYPPGIPLVLMGETIHQEEIDHLLGLIAKGRNVRGLKKRKDEYWVQVYN